MVANSLRAVRKCVKRFDEHRRLFSITEHPWPRESCRCLLAAHPPPRTSPTGWASLTTRPSTQSPDRPCSCMGSRVCLQPCRTYPWFDIIRCRNAKRELVQWIGCRRRSADVTAPLRRWSAFNTGEHFDAMLADDLTTAGVPEIGGACVGASYRACTSTTVGAVFTLAAHRPRRGCPRGRHGETRSASS
jgi:hypothetical protein